MWPALRILLRLPDRLLRLALWGGLAAAAAAWIAGVPGLLLLAAVRAEAEAAGLTLLAFSPSDLSAERARFDALGLGGNPALTATGVTLSFTPLRPRLLSDLSLRVTLPRLLSVAAETLAVSFDPAAPLRWPVPTGGAGPSAVGLDLPDLRAEAVALTVATPTGPLVATGEISLVGGSVAASLAGEEPGFGRLALSLDAALGPGGLSRLSLEAEAVLPSGAALSARVAGVPTGAGLDLPDLHLTVAGLDLGGLAIETATLAGSGRIEGARFEGRARLTGSALPADPQTRLRVDLPLLLAGDASGVTLAAAGAGRAETTPFIRSGVTFPAGLTLVDARAGGRLPATLWGAPGPLELTLAGRLLPADPQVPTLGGPVAVAGGRVALRLLVAEGARPRLEVGVRGLDLLATEPPVAATGLEADAVWTPDEGLWRGRLLRVRVAPRGDTPWPALTLSGPIALTGDEIAAELAARLPGGPLALSATLRHGALNGTGRADLTLHETQLAGLLMGDRLLAGRLGLAQASGTVSGSARFDWGEAGWGRSGRLVLSEVELVRTDGFGVGGLSTSLAFTALDPPASQEAELRAAWVGLPWVTDFAGRGRIEPGDPPVLALAGGTGRVFGAQLAFGPVRFDPGGSGFSLAADVAGIDLAAVLGTLGRPDIAGTGVLDGAVRLRVGEDGPALGGTRFVARGPGVLRLGARTLAAALAGSGPEAAALAEALADFRYTALALEVVDVRTDRVELALRLDGRNPAVLDGQRFVVTTNFAIDPSDLLRALPGGAVLEALGRGTWKPAP